MQNKPGGQMRQGGAPTKSELLPFLGKGELLTQKGFLIPVIATFATSLILFHSGFDTAARVIGLYLGICGFYFIYRLCGKRKPWWLFTASAGIVFLLIQYPRVTVIWHLIYSFFENLLVGGVSLGTPAWQQLNPVSQFLKCFLGIGLAEELVKALPALALFFLAKRLSSPWREQAGVFEPLDGILIATAAATGFTMSETLWQYYASSMNGFIKGVVDNGGNPAFAMGAAYAMGLKTLLARLLGNITGHIAYSGLFGYFIGLAALRPDRKWALLGIGWGSAAFIHGCWDFTNSTTLEVVIGTAGYVLLATAILKARQISPERAQNFATMLVGAPAGGGNANPQVHAAAAQAKAAGAALAKAAGPAVAKAVGMVQEKAAAFAAAAGQQVHNGAVKNAAPAANKAAANANGALFTLRIGSRNLGLADGAKLRDADIPGLEPLAGAYVAELTRNPANPSMIGLKNLSRTAWRATAPDGTVREVPASRSVLLERGTRIDFGIVEAAVQ